MVKQYVGARYVPKFARPVEWAADTSYEALTIVTFNNASYTSKVPVPPTVGNPANNPQYWVLTGNYNAQVEQYRQETETVSNNLTTEITKVEQYRQEAETVSNNLTTEITNRKNADTALQGQITTEITNRKNADTTLQGQITTEFTSRETADATLQDNINSEAATRASADSKLQTQINQIVAPSGEAPSAAEVQNARIGADGVTYDTLGTAIRTQVNNLNEALRKQLDLQELYKQKTVTSIQGYYDPEFKGLGTLVTNLPPIITNIEIQTKIKGTGNAKLELLNENKVVIASAISTFTNELVFKFNDLYVGNYDKLWIRVSSETLLFARAECGINANIVDTSENYGAYFTNNNWYYTNHYNYTLLFTLNGKIGNNSVIVGANEKFKRIIDAVQYCNIRPNYVWNIYIKEGVYDVYNELGGSSWYSGITSAKGNMQGISLRNNVNLIGIGNVILQFNPSDELATENNVPNVSVLELSDINNKIENIKIECKNCRYGIHDETDGSKPNSKRMLKNVTVTHNGCKSGTWNVAVSYGCGTSDNAIFEYENCNFVSGWLAHQTASQTVIPKFFATSCKFGGGAYAISLNTSGSGKAEITFNNCNINHTVRILEDENVWTINGSANNDFRYVVIGHYTEQTYMQLNDCTMLIKAKTDITKFAPVRLDSGGIGGVTTATSHIGFLGIALENVKAGNYVRIKTKGFVDVYAKGLFNGNDYIGVSENGTLIVDNINPIAYAYNEDGINYIKIL